ncbi:hypothetical protein NDU88_002776 [Pleurodeles waltl]|uniref:Uncharacterized protein n=1 Tax=Pleurodeles waltl TaxID=8319 RepID=A0AAV7KT26_PLEWA|nr:hypothetical protein NDU88_002776 [Pleurodeles waltl]
MGVRLDHHATCLVGVECGLSEVEPDSANAVKRLEIVQQLLKDVVDKNKDLEARSHRNNIRISGVAESTNMGRSDTLVEKLLTDLFGHATK